MAEPTERDPLIKKPLAVVQVNATAESAFSENSDRDDNVKQGQLGPLEISASNRRGILAGIWMASFLGFHSCLQVSTASRVINIVLFKRTITSDVFDIFRVPEIRPGQLAGNRVFISCLHVHALVWPSVQFDGPSMSEQHRHSLRRYRYHWLRSLPKYGIAHLLTNHCGYRSSRLFHHFDASQAASTRSERFISF
ncbi:hypothetical protein B0H13DRAFT_2503587 [Mycena leptocephala]|nr:hypothetical protein B0H13DRAFT_2503587 [Mycena leptocephala]